MKYLKISSIINHDYNHDQVNQIFREIIISNEIVFIFSKTSTKSPIFLNQFIRASPQALIEHIFYNFIRNQEYNEIHNFITV